MFSKNQIKQENSVTNELTDFDNLVAFYDLLLKIDKRTHPEIYQDDASQ